MALKPTPVALRPMFEPDPYTTLDRGPVVPSYIGEQDRDPRSSTYAEVIADNLFGLENRYDSVGEQFARQFNADELGVLKQMGLGALSGTVDFLRDIPGGVQGYGEDIYSAVKDLATDSREDRLRSAAADQLLLGKNVDGTPMEFDRYSAVWQQLNPVRGNPADPLDLLTDEEFTQLDMSVREGQLSDVMTAGSVVPVGAGIKTAGQLGIAGVRKLDGVIDKKFRAQAEGKLRDLGYEDAEITNFLEGRGFFPRALATEGSTDVLSTNSVFGLSEADANRVLAAERLRNEGASAAEIFDETGLEFYPIRDAGGNLVQEFAVSRLSKFGPPDERGVGTLTPKLNFDMGRLEEIFANGKATNLDLSDIISTDDPATLKALEGYRLDFSVEPKEDFGGYHRKEDKTINVNLGKKPSLARIQSVLNHEVEHAVGRFLFDDVAKTGTRYIDASYFQPGSTGRSKIRDYSVAAGANPKSLYDYKRERIADLRAKIANYENKLSTATPPNEVDPFRDVQGGFRTQEYLDDAREELAALLSMTSNQAYRSNVGEISASSTQPEGPQQVVSLTGLETLNPYLRNNRNVPFSAIPDAVLSKLLPENRVMAIENRLYGSQASGAGAQENPLLQKLSPEVAGRSQLFVPTSFEDARELRIPVQVRQNADLDDIPFRDGGMVRDTRFTGLGSMGYML